LYVVLLVTALAGDVAWYFVGAHYGERFVGRLGPYVSVTPAHVERVKTLFHRYHTQVLLLSKITNAFGFAIVILFTAGLTKIPFGRYMTTSARRL
jgi:membrane protein DedA with SNARE-associated domain